MILIHVQHGCCFSIPFFATSRKESTVVSVLRPYPGLYQSTD